MKKIYVVTLNALIEFSNDVKAEIGLIGVFDTQDKAKQAAKEYGWHHVSDEHPEVQAELAEGIIDVIEIKEIDLNTMYPDLELSYERY